MKKISASKTSIIINKRRMNYLSKKDVVGELFSISFNKEMDSQLSQDISGSILTNKKSLLENSDL